MTTIITIIINQNHNKIKKEATIIMPYKFDNF